MGTFFDPHEYAPEWAAKVLGAQSSYSPQQTQFLSYTPDYRFATDEEGKAYWYTKIDSEGNVSSPDDRHYFGPDDVAGWSAPQQQDYYWYKGMTGAQQPGGWAYQPGDPGNTPTFWDAALASIPFAVAGGVLGAGAAGGLGAAGAEAGAAGAAGVGAAGGLGSAFSVNNPALWWSALQALQHLSADQSGGPVGGVLGGLAGTAGGALLGVPGGGALGGVAGSQVGGAIDPQSGEQVAQLLQTLLPPDQATQLMQDPMTLFWLLTLLQQGQR